MVEIKVKRLYKDVDLPIKSAENVYDIWMYDEELDISRKLIKYKTGLAFDIPEGYIGLVVPRFRMSLTHAQMANGIGIIHPNCGDTELVIHCTISHGHFKYEEDKEKNENVCIGLAPFPKPNKPARIAQLIVIPIPDITLVEVSE